MTRKTDAAIKRASRDAARDRATIYVQAQDRLLDLAATVLAAQTHQSAITAKYAAQIEKLEARREEESRQWRLKTAQALREMSTLCAKNEVETRTGISPAVLNSELGWLDEQDSPVQEDLGDTAVASLPESGLDDS